MARWYFYRKWALFIDSRGGPFQYSGVKSMIQDMKKANVSEVQREYTTYSLLDEVNLPGKKKSKLRKDT